MLHHHRLEDRPGGAAELTRLRGDERCSRSAGPRAGARLGTRGDPSQCRMPRDRRYANVARVRRRAPQPRARLERARAGAAARSPGDTGRDRGGRALPLLGGGEFHHRRGVAGRWRLHGGVTRRETALTRLPEKVCIITGSGSGIGRATALLFAREGARVVVADIDASGADDTVRQAVAAGGRASTRVVDVTDPQQAEGLAEQTINDFGRIDVLFNNAGISGVGTLHETTLELWQRVMQVNVTGVFLTSKYVVPHMISRRAGSIINMSSSIADIGLANRASYAASKGAVLSLTRAMQVDYAPYGIRVNALLPGTIHTAFVEKYLRESYPDREEGLAVIRKRQLTAELGTPDDVASAALFLASDESRFVMGSAFFIDGGMRGGK